MSANENELQRLEHDQTYHVKKAGLWGYDASSGGLRMVAVNTDGSLPITDLLVSKISTLNSTNQQLAENETWTGTWEDVTQYAEAIVTIYTTHSSITNGLKIQWSMNGVDVQGDDLFTIGANSGKTFSFPCQTKYLRVTYTNNGVATTTFQLQTSLKVRASKGSSHRLADALVGQDDAIVTKTLISGFTTAGGGGIVDVKVNPSGALAVSVGDSALPTGAATESTLRAVAGLNIPAHDTILATYPDSTTEVYTYKLSGTTVATVTVTYTDSTKSNLSSVIKS